MLGERWFSRHRQEWIAEMIHIYGFINREHLMIKFEISMPQASADIQHFIKTNPNIMAYNASAKRYERPRK